VKGVKQRDNGFITKKTYQDCDTLIGNLIAVSGRKEFSLMGDSPIKL
jgi:hypothetical protein